MNYQPGDEISGKYKILSFIGGGAMGMVYKAEHILMQKIVAIKILKTGNSGNSEMLERFKREAKAAAAIEHDNICHVMDFDTTEDGEPFLVMEFLEGESLQKRIKDTGHLSPVDTVFIMKQLLSVLQCAHDNGIVHRDVKPENITLIPKDDTQNFVKLLDFGIAHQEDACTLSKNDGSSEFKTQAGFLYGTPEFIAPEQAAGEKIDYRVDLYACGIILYEMLTGDVPFKSDSLINLLHDQIYAPPPHLDCAKIECGQQFDNIIQKLLSKKPEDRYSSALAVSEALQNIPLTKDNSDDHSQNNIFRCSISSFSIASIPSLLKNFKQWPPKYRYVVYLSTAILVLLIIIIIIASVAISSDELSPIEITDNAEPADLKEVTDVQPFLYNEKAFALSDDETLRKDHNLLKAAEAYFQKDYETCYNNITVVEKRYENHPNYLRLRMQAAQSLASSRSVPKDSERYKSLMASITSDFIKLTSMVPDAAKNEAVRNALAVTFTDIKNGFSADTTVAQILDTKNEKLTLALAWAITYLPYDDNETRKKRIFSVYDLLPQDDIPEWQKDTLEAWRLDKNKCKQREEILVKAFQEKASNEELYYGILVPLYENLRLNEHDKKKRYKCKANAFQSLDCNHCMKWIETGYDAWTEQLKAGNLSNATLDFLPQNDK